MLPRMLLRVAVSEKRLVHKRKFGNLCAIRAFSSIVSDRQQAKTVCFQQKCCFSASSTLNGFFSSFSKQEESLNVPLEKTYSFIDNVVSESSTSLPIELLPDVDPAPVGDMMATTSDAIPTFSDLGLGGSLLPHHIIQDVLEYLHTTVGLEWCPAIAILTVILRLLAVPAYITVRAFSVRSANAYPTTRKLQEAIMDARVKRNLILANKAKIEYMEHMRTHNINPMKSLLYQLPNGIMFMSMFAALRGMCMAGLPSMTDGGALWFTNLTVPDPFMILPILSCMSMSAIIRFGAADAEMGPLANVNVFRKVMVWLPIVSIPFLVYQPAAMFAFWVVSNVFTVTLVTIFRSKAVKKACGIPEFVKHDKSVIDSMQASVNPFALHKKMKEKQTEARVLLEKMEEHKKLMKKIQEQQKKQS